MFIDTFIKVVTKQFNEVLPFVVYAKPKSTSFSGLLQEDDLIHTVSNFKEMGFVFAPFDNKNKTILIPFNKAEEIQTDIQNFTAPPHSSELETINNKSSHIKLVSNGIKTISTSEIDKIVLSRIETVHLSSLNLRALLQQLFSSDSSAFRYCWYHPKIGLWLGATPETLCKVEGKRFETMSLAGTQLYPGHLDVYWDTKEQEEQQIVTDFILTQLKPLVKHLQASKTETIQAGNVVHLRTKIRGVLSQNEDLKSVLECLHPTPAVCGLPKDKAKQFILDQENYNRTYYTGFLGVLNKEVIKRPKTSRRNIELRAFETHIKSTQLFVNLRCMELQDRKALIYVGGGITKDSIPDKEWEETLNKTNIMKNVLK
ncbi:MAG: chorismate-binding protein [Flavobacteriaceae bacterium]|nr:chorismate-binding protein [Flavobacteriaceae bacterium]